MAESAHDVTQRAADLASKALQEAERLAFERGQAAAIIEARLASHEQRLDAINGSIKATAGELHSLRDEVRKVVEAFNTATAVAETRARDFKAATESQISTRTFLVSLVVVVIMLAALIIGMSK